VNTKDALKIVPLRSSDPIMEGPMGPIPERSENPEGYVHATTENGSKALDLGWPNREAHARPVG
jgi:hypothetical protein